MKGFLEETYKTVMDGILKRLDLRFEEIKKNPRLQGSFKAGFKLAYVCVEDMEKEFVEKAKKIDKEEG